MPNWKKVAISGSNISQFNNDGVYTKMVGTTANGLLTYVNTETACVEPKIIYDSTLQRLCNYGQINVYSGSFPSGQEPGINPTSAATFATLLASDKACYTPTGSKNSTLSVVGRHSTFGAGGVCGATISLTSQVGNSNKNATTQFTSIGKENNCHDAIFIIGLKKDAGGVSCHPINEFLRMDGRDSATFLSSSLSIQTDKMPTTGSIGGVLVYDDTTGQIKKSTLTPSTTTTSPGGGNTTVQFNDNGAFGGDGGLTYNAIANELTAGKLISENLQSATATLLVTCKVQMADLTTTAATTCNSIVISSTGELLNGPVISGGGTAAGAFGNIQYNNGSNGFAAESALTYQPFTNTLSADNISTNKVTGVGEGLVITDGDNDTDVEICSYGTKKATFSETATCIGVSGNTNAFVCNLARVIIPDGTVSKPSLVFVGDQDMGFYRIGTVAALSLAGSSAVAGYFFTRDGLKTCRGSLAVGNITPSTTVGRIDASNDIVSNSTSDCRLKKHIKPIPNALDKIDQIRGVEFDCKVTDEKMKQEVHSFEGHDVGVIAQEIEAVLPEVVTTRDSGYKAVRYEKIVPLLIQGIKELKSEVEILKSKI